MPAEFPALCRIAAIPIRAEYIGPPLAASAKAFTRGQVLQAKCRGSDVQSASAAAVEVCPGINGAKAGGEGKNPCGPARYATPGFT